MEILNYVHQQNRPLLRSATRPLSKILFSFWH